MLTLVNIHHQTDDKYEKNQKLFQTKSPSLLAQEGAEDPL